MRILLVDDENPALEMLSDLLGDYGGKFEVLTAGNGKEAVEILASRYIDLLITDLWMPQMNGFELLAYTARNYPGIPAIAMTASFDGETYEKLGALGISDYLVKPFAFADLLEKIYTCKGAHPDAQADKPLPDACRAE